MLRRKLSTPPKSHHQFLFYRKPAQAGAAATRIQAGQAWKEASELASQAAAAAEAQARKLAEKAQDAVKPASPPPAPKP